MAVQSIFCKLFAGDGDPSNPPGFPAGGLGASGRPVLAFDDTQDELILWTFQMPENYGTGLQGEILWSGSSSTTTSHTVRWVVEIMKLTPETAGAVDSDSYDSFNAVDDDILGTTSKRLQKATVSITNADSVQAGDYVAVRLRREASHANDDLPEDAWLLDFTLKYTTA